MLTEEITAVEEALEIIHESNDEVMEKYGLKKKCVEEREKEIARDLIKIGIPLEKVAQGTKLPLAVIQQLAQSIK